MDKQQPAPSPFYKDIRWDAWAFFTFGTCGVAFLGAYFGADGNLKAGVAASVAVFLPVARAFLANPKGLPWVEIGQKAVSESAHVIEEKNDVSQ